MNSIKIFIREHASGIGLIIAGAILYISGNQTDGVAMLTAGIVSFSLKASIKKDI